MRKFALLNIKTQELYDIMNETEFQVFINYIMKQFKLEFINYNIDNFINFFNKYYFISGKTDLGYKRIDEYSTIHLFKQQKVSICELFNTNNDNIYNVRFINPENIFINYKYVNNHNYLMYSKFNKPILKYKHKIDNYKPHYKMEFRNTSTKHSSYYQRTKLTDKYFYRSLNEPYNLKSKNINPFSELDAPRKSEKNNWKSNTKDKHQWEHNLPKHCDYIPRKSRKQLLKEFNENNK